MRRIIAGCMLAALLIGCAGCAFFNPEAVRETQASRSSPAEPSAGDEMDIGDTITTEHCRVTIEAIELAYDVLPEKEDGLFTHYKAAPGRVYICVSLEVKNRTQVDLRCDELGWATAHYNGNQQYRSFTVVEDAYTGFALANLSAIRPGEAQRIKLLIECPQQVHETRAPLWLAFDIDGTSFKYTIRE